MAGDLTIYGMRDNVKLIGQGKITSRKLLLWT